MKYYIKYFIVNDGYQTVDHQLCNNISPKPEEWSQLTSFDIDTSRNGVYVPYFLFIQYDTDIEKAQIEKHFNGKIVDKKNHNLGNYITENVVMIGL